MFAFNGCTGLISVTFAAGSAISSANFGTDVFPGNDNLKTAYLAGGAGTYTRASGGTTWAKQGGGVSNVLDGTWNAGSPTRSITLNGNTWTYAENGSPYSRGTWSANFTVAYGSSGKLTLTINEFNSGGSWGALPSQYQSVKTNTVDVSINSGGTTMTLSNPVLTTAGVWGTTAGVYTRSAGPAGGTLTITGVPANLVSNVPSWGGSVGTFPTGTTIQQALAHTAAQQAGADFEYAVVTSTAGNTFTVAVTLLTAPAFNTSWTGSGSYQVFVLIGTSSNAGVAYGVSTSFSSGSATLNFSSFTNLGNFGGGSGHSGTQGLAFEPIGSPTTAYRVSKGSVTSGAVVIPSTNNGLPVTAIGNISDNSAANGAFFQTSITSITIPSSVTSIGGFAFSHCSNLPGITIPASVTSIGDFAFNDCTSLTSVTFAAGSNITNQNFGSNASPQASGYTGDALKVAYLAGGAGTYTRSSGGSDWAKQGSGGNTGPWTAVTDSKFGTSDILVIAHGNNRFVAGGMSGKMAYSSDGVTWNSVTTNAFGDSADRIYAIAYGNGKFVAGGHWGRMAYSSDGVTWNSVTNSTFGTSDYVKAIAYGNNTFVAVGSGDSGSKMAYSSDGVTWSSVTNSTFVHDITDIVFGDGKFIAVGDYNGEMATSTNGTSWTAGTLGSGVYAITYGNDRFVGVGGGEISYSSNGETWGSVSVSSTALDSSIEVIAFGNGKFIAGLFNTKISTSTNGETWTAVMDSTFGSPNGQIKDIAYGNGKFVVVGLGGKMAYLADN